MCQWWLHRYSIMMSYWCYFDVVTVNLSVFYFTFFFLYCLGFCISYWCFLLWCSFLATKMITIALQWYLFSKKKIFFLKRKKKQCNGFPLNLFSKAVAAVPLFIFMILVYLMTTVLFFKKIINNATKEETMYCSFLTKMLIIIYGKSYIII